MLLLPNGKQLDSEGITDAMKSKLSERAFLDTATGEIGVIDDKEILTALGKKRLEEISHNARYIEIPHVTDVRKRKWLREFIKTFLKEGNKKERQLYQSIDDEIKSKNIDRFDKAIVLLEKSSTGWIHGWSQWYFDELWNDMDTWLETLPFEIEDVFDGDDDCELCKLLAQGEHTIGDFNEALQKEHMKDKNSLYYDAMEKMQEGDSSEALRLLKKALIFDESYVQTHVGLAAAYREIGNKNLYHKHGLQAFKETQKCFPKWPKKMEWGIIENRQFLRAILFRADMYTEEGDKKSAIELYTLLMTLCPDDNLGVRHVLKEL